VPSTITYAAVLDVRRATAEHLAKLLRGHREQLGTRKGTRALGVFKQAVLVLRWFVDGTRLVQLARDNGTSVPAAYRVSMCQIAVMIECSTAMSAFIGPRRAVSRL
jgi:hypothetical protein